MILRCIFLVMRVLYALIPIPSNTLGVPVGIRPRLSEPRHIAEFAAVPFRAEAQIALSLLKHEIATLALCHGGW